MNAATQLATLKAGYFIGFGALLVFIGVTILIIAVTAGWRQRRRAYRAYRLAQEERARRHSSGGWFD